MTRIAAALALTCALLPARAARAADRIEGYEQAVYDWQGLKPGNYQNNGFQQKVTAEGKLLRIEITSDFSPLQSRVPFPVAPARYPAELRLAPLAGSEGMKLAGNAQTMYEAAFRILAAVKGRLAYDAAGSPDLPAALKAGKGNCVALSTLALQWLHEAGLAARPVTGVFLPRSQAKLELKGAALHRFIEIYFPDRGWVFTDPARTFAAVTGEYIYLGPAGGDYGGYAGAALTRRSLHNDWTIEKRGEQVFYTRANIRDRELSGAPPAKAAGAGEVRF
jgi:transglutaminase-like putative cysteine protease